MTATDARIDETTSPPRPSRRRRRLVVPVLAVLAVVIAWGVAAALAVTTAADELEVAATSFREARDLLLDTEIVAAAAPLRTGTAAASSAVSRLEAWYVRPAAGLPFVGDSLAAATTIGRGVRDVGADLEEVVALGIGVLTSSEDGDASVTELSLASAGALAPLVRQLDATARRTLDEVGAVDPARVVDRVAAARQDYLDVVEPSLERLAVLGDVAEVLPTLLGADGPRTYLFAAASLSELRASGGLLGSWTLLRIDAGQLDFGTFSQVDDLPAIEAPLQGPSEEHAARYGPLGSLEHWRNINVSPDFPSAAQLALEAWEQGGRAPLDGVIVADTVTFARLVERSGGVEIPGVGILGPQETLAFVGLESYGAFDDHAERKRDLGALASSLFDEVASLLGADDLVATARTLGELTAGGHLRVYSADARAQQVLEQVGVAGHLPPTAGESVGVFVSNVAANKVDYFTSRRVEHRVQLLPGGSTRTVTEVTFTNDAPREGHPRYVLGPVLEGREAGDNRSLVTFVCSTTCELRATPSRAQPAAVELGRPVVDTWLDVPAGESRTLRFTTESRDAWVDQAGQAVLRVEHLVQPTVWGVEVALHVVVPDGLAVAAMPDGAQLVDGEVVLAPATSGAFTAEVAFVPEGRG